MQAKQKHLVHPVPGGAARLLPWKAMLRALTKPLAERWRRTCRTVAMVDRRPARMSVLKATEVRALNRKAPGSLGRSFQDEFADQESGLQTVLVIWKGRKPIATGFIHWPGPRYAAVRAVYPHCPEIFRLHVLPSYRSQGWGTRLIEGFEQMAQERGCSQVGLGVAYANLHAANLYQRLGYEQPQQSDFVDEFDTVDSNGERYRHATHAHFLVKTL